MFFFFFRKKKVVLFPTFRGNDWEVVRALVADAL
jgi:hypothetical protein